jgi:hypothetical protein
MTFDLLEHASAEPGASCAGRIGSLVIAYMPIAQKAHGLRLLVRPRPFDHAKPPAQGRAVAPKQPIFVLLSQLLLSFIDLDQTARGISPAATQWRVHVARSSGGRACLPSPHQAITFCPSDSLRHTMAAFATLINIKARQ